MFVVYATTGGLVDSIRATQALANTRAGESTALTAYSGTVTVPRWVTPGRSFFDSTDATFKIENVPTLSAIQQLRAAVRQVQELTYGEAGLYARVERTGWGFPYALKADVEDMLLCGERGFYIDMRDSTLAISRRIDLAHKILLGPSDIIHSATDPYVATRSLYRVVRGATNPSGWTRGEQQMRPLLWDSGTSTYGRRTLQASLDAARTEYPLATRVPDFANVDLQGEAWVTALTA